MFRRTGLALLAGQVCLAVGVYFFFPVLIQAAPLPGLMAGYTLDERSGTTAADISSNNYQATLYNGPVWVTGQFGGALGFDGSNDRVRSNTIVSLPGQFSIVAWVNNPSAQAYETILTVGTNRDFYLESGRISFYDGTAERNFGSNIGSGWHHVAIVSTGSQLIAYLDGTQRGNAANASLSSASGVIQLGSWIIGGSNVDFLNGTLDEVGVFSRALSPSEIQASMNSALDGGGLPSPTPSPLPTPTLTPTLPPPTPTPPAATPTPPSNLPTVTLAAPTPGVISGTTIVSADASDDTGIAFVRFMLDNKRLGGNPDDAEVPYEVSWDTVKVPNGSYSLTAIAQDLDGNQTTSAPVIVDVFNDGLLTEEALRFHGNGVNDIDRVKIRIDDPANSNPGPPADIGSQDFTLEFWMRANSADNPTAPVACGANVNWINGNIIVDRDRYNQDRKFGLSVAGGRIVFGVTGEGGGGRTICSTSDVLDDLWHHVAVTRRRSDGWMQLYVDGNLEAEFNGPDGDISYPDDGVPGNFCGVGGNQPCTNSDPYLVIGAEKHDAGPGFPSYSGYLDELRLSNVLRYTANFSPPVNVFSPDADTVGLYNFNEGEGDEVNDTSEAIGGPSNGVRKYGGSPAGPGWVKAAPFGPKAEILAPTAGETIVGSVIDISYLASGNVAEVDHIHLQLDTNLEQPDYDLDGNFQFTNVPVGQHTIRAYLVNSTHSHITGLTDDEVAFENVANPSDTTPPTVTMTNPQNGVSVAGTIEVRADAFDDVGMAGVQFLLDGVNLGQEDTQVPYAITWNTSTVSDGSYNLSALARDIAGNETVSEAVNVTVDNSGQNPVLVGQWSSLLTWPIAPVHAVLQPNGEVLVWDEENSGSSARLWNPTSQAFTAVPNTNSNIFCAGHALMANGQTLVIGGHAGTNFFGIADVNSFDISSQTWARQNDMAYERWYPTATTLGDGKVLATSGWITPSQLASIPEIYDPTTGNWTELPGAQKDVAMYSFMFNLPDGRIFNAGPGVINGTGSTMTNTLDIGSQSWTDVSNSLITGHSAVMYEPGKIMKSGQLGDPDYPLPTVHGRTVVIDMSQPNPAWQEVAAMNIARSYHNLVILPDGTVLAVGGGASTNGQNVNSAVYTTELWNPSTQTWTEMANQQRPRLYHSNALLLPDGRVLSDGGYFPPYVEESAEIYSPPYLFKGPRPTITQAPDTAVYGQDIFVETPESAGISSVVLMRTGAPTHGFDQNQRRVPVSFSQTANGLNVSMPTSSNVAPPGYYLLFILNSGGVPSEGAFIELNLSPTPTLTLTPTPTPIVTLTPTPLATPTPTPLPLTPTPTPVLPTPTPTLEPTPTLTLTPTPTPRTGRSLQFDGANDLVQGVDLPLSTQFTYEAWVKRTADANGYQTFMSDANSGYEQAMFSLYVDGGNTDCPAGPTDEFAYYQIAGNEVACSGVTADLGVWHHVAVSRDASNTLRFFVDGQLTRSTTNSAAPADSTGLLALGRAGSYNGEYFAGLLDEARISNVALYTTDFTPSTALTADANTVMLYHLDEGGGQVVTDASGNGRDAVLGTASSAQTSDPLWSSDVP